MSRVRSLIRRGILLRGGVRPLVSDTFTRADSTTSLGSADTGQVWTALRGTFGISSNQGYASVISASSDAIATLDAGVADGLFGVDMAVPGATPSHALIVRAVDVDNFIMARWNQGGSAVQLYKQDTAAFTLLASVAKSGSGAHRIEIEAKAAVLRVLVDSVEQFSHTLTSAEQTKYGSATGVGFRIVATDARVDNLKVTA